MQKFLFAHWTMIRHSVWIVIAAVTLLVSAAANALTIRFVDGELGSPNGPGTGWGSSAYRYLRDAIGEANLYASLENPYEIRVRGSNNPQTTWNKYRPDATAANGGSSCIGNPPDCDRTATFSMHNNVNIRGGYVGAADPLGRNPAVYVTYLWGKLQDSPEVRSYHVVSAISPGLPEPPIGPTAILDGFTVAWGQATDGGGGVYILNATPIIRNCIFEYNSVSNPPNATIGDGGAIASVLEASYPAAGPEIRNCLFRHNSAPAFGGAIVANKRAAILNCDFVDNWAGIGGAVALQQARLFDVVSCTMIDNHATGTWDSGLQDWLNQPKGGGIWASGWTLGVPGTINITNTALCRNSAAASLSSPEEYGGGLYALVSLEIVLQITNCTFADNSADDGGGGLYLGNLGVVPREEDAPIWEIHNSIFWDNSAPSGPQILDATYPPQQPTLQKLRLTYTDIQDGWTGPGYNNSDFDPVFINPAGDNYRLSCSSPCINAADEHLIPWDAFNIDGDDLSAPPNPAERTPDIDLALRVNREVPDQGCYEAHGCRPGCTADIWPIGTGDYTVDGNDLLEVINHWGMPGGDADVYPPCGGDGIINGSDLTAVIGAWGPCNCLGPGEAEGGMSAPMGNGGELPTWLQNCMNACGEDGECLAQCILEAMQSGGVP